MASFFNDGWSRVVSRAKKVGRVFSRRSRLTVEQLEERLTPAGTDAGGYEVLAYAHRFSIEIDSPLPPAPTIEFYPVLKPNLQAFPVSFQLAITGAQHYDQAVSQPPSTGGSWSFDFIYDLNVQVTVPQGALPGGTQVAVYHGDGSVRGVVTPPGPPNSPLWLFVATLSFSGTQSGVFSGQSGGQQSFQGTIESLTDKLERMTLVGPDRHRPPTSSFDWGVSEKVSSTGSESYIITPETTPGSGSVAGGIFTADVTEAQLTPSNGPAWMMHA